MHRESHRNFSECSTCCWDLCISTWSKVSHWNSLPQSFAWSTGKFRIVFHLYGWGSNPCGRCSLASYSWHVVVIWRNFIFCLNGEWCGLLWFWFWTLRLTLLVLIVLALCWRGKICIILWFWFGPFLFDTFNFNCFSPLLTVLILIALVLCWRGEICNILWFWFRPFLFDNFNFNCFSPLLTWRDMQHIVVLTARVANLVADDWVTNGVGKKGTQSCITSSVTCFCFNCVNLNVNY